MKEKVKLITKWNFIFIFLFTTLGVFSQNPGNCSAVFEYKQGCGNEFQFTLKNIQDPATQYLWNFGDGVTSTDKSPIHKYATNDYHKVTLQTKIDGALLCTDKSSQLIKVFTKFKAKFSYFQNPQNQLEYNFYNASTGEHLKYSWDLGDGRTVTTTNTDPIIHTYSNNVLHVVHLKITDTISGCTTEYLDSLNKCSANFSYGRYHFSNAVYSFSPDNKNLTGIWDFGDGSTSTQTEVVHTFPMNASFNVCRTVSTPDCGPIKSCQVINTANPCKPKFEISRTFDANPNSVFLVNKTEYNAMGTKFSIDFGDGSPLETGNGGYSHTYRNIGVYTVCLTTKDSATNCEATYCDSVVISEINCSAQWYSYPVATTDSDPNTVIISVDLPTFNNKASYLWDFGDGQTSIDINVSKHSYTTSGEHTICLTCTDTVNHCFAKDCHKVIISTCSADFTYTENSSSPGTYLFAPKTTGNSYTYLWNFDGKDRSTLKNPAYTFVSGGLHTVGLSIMSTTDIYCRDTINKIMNVSVGIKENKRNQIVFENYPNPFTESTTIHYILAKNADIQLTVYDLLGNKIELIENTSKPAGDYKLNWQVQNLPPGMYLLQLNVNGEVSTQKMVIQN